MKNLFARLALAAALGGLLHSIQPVLAQGNLTPPGPPGPTMITLNQIEPRTPISSASLTITNSGSYYLTTNIIGVNGANGIVIAVNNVTLDLNGFALVGSPGVLDGIYFPYAVTNITVRNGVINNWVNGVDGLGAAAANLVFERLNISSNNGYALRAYAATCVVRDCNCSSNTGGGIDVTGLVTGCTVNNNNGAGIGGYPGTVIGCTANNNSVGINVGPGSVSGCTCAGNNTGIQVGASCEIIGNTCSGNSTAIVIGGGNNRIENNHIAASGSEGIYVAFGSDNIIIKNSVSGNGANNYIGLSGQIAGPLINTTGTITNLNPWANFSF